MNIPIEPSGTGNPILLYKASEGSLRLLSICVPSEKLSIKIWTPFGLNPFGLNHSEKS